MNILGLRLNFVDCESFLESNSPDILSLCERSLHDSTDSVNFSVRGYLSLMQKDSTTHMHGCAVYVKQGFLLHGIYLWNTLQIHIYVFNWLYFTQCLTFSSVNHPLCFYAWFLILFHLT